MKKLSRNTMLIRLRYMIIKRSRMETREDIEAVFAVCDKAKEMVTRDLTRFYRGVTFSEALIDSGCEPQAAINYAADVNK